MRSRLLGAIGVALTAVLVVAAGYEARTSEAGGTDAHAKLSIIAPAAAGGGWDLVARTAQQALRANGIVVNPQVQNVPGAGGTIGLGQLVRRDGEATTLMVTGTVMLGGIAISPSGLNLGETTPIARVAEDFEVIVVPADSEYETLEDFIAEWEQDPGGLPVGGGSAGGIDHMIAGQLAQAVGIDPGEIEYAAYAGGGELTTGLLSTAQGTPNVGISGYNDFRDLIEAGRLRPLAVVSPEPIDGVDAPTMIELGYDSVDLVNWRGFVAPAGLTQEETDELIAIVTEMVETPDWAEAIEVNRWKESFLTGDEFGEFLETEQQRIDALLEELDL